jgi:AcrR family transcriptional regulator
MATAQPRPAQDARIVRTRDALHTALLRLLEYRPLDQITIREITAQANIGYATFFRHHPSKEALLEDVAAEQIHSLVELSLPLFDATDTRPTCLALCSYVMANRTLWSALLTGGAAGAMREEFIRVSRRVADDNFNHADWLPVDLGVIHSSSAIIGILAWWLQQPEPMPVDRVAEILDRLVISPLGASGREAREAGGSI